MRPPFRTLCTMYIHWSHFHFSLPAIGKHSHHSDFQFWMDPFKTMDALGQTPPKDILDGQNQATPPATTPVRECAWNLAIAFVCVCVCVCVCVLGRGEIEKEKCNLNPIGQRGVQFRQGVTLKIQGVTSLCLGSGGILVRKRASERRDSWSYEWED